MATFAMDCTIRAEWLMITPLGFPVVPEVKQTIAASSGAQKWSNDIDLMVCLRNVSAVDTFDVFMKPEEKEPMKKCHLREVTALLCSSEYQKLQLSSVTNITGFVISIADFASSKLCS
uniref:2-succinylbenzoateCoA ligaseic/peroxisomal-like isoform X3 n=1 Tax=Rhizophora mucronata TaxID=61149 RepID=A0A2P2LMJ4_RHIMU